MDSKEDAKAEANDAADITITKKSALLSIKLVVAVVVLLYLLVLFVRFYLFVRSFVHLIVRFEEVRESNLLSLWLLVCCLSVRSFIRLFVHPIVRSSDCSFVRLL